jgi:hypothetical protein
MFYVLGEHDSKNLTDCSAKLQPAFADAEKTFVMAAYGQSK